jgi:hypothetical protein
VSSSPVASSIAKCDLSISAAFAALTIGNGENSDGRAGKFLDESMLSVESVAEVLMVLLVVVRLDLEGDLRIVGVRRDSWAFGSSNLVYRPMEGR